MNEADHGATSKEIDTKLTLPEQVLVVRAGETNCALRIEDIIEQMRPLPVEPLVGAPPFVLGVALIRGSPLPVVDLRLLLHPKRPVAPAGRFVTLRVADHSLALAVDQVLDARALDAGFVSLPPLLQDAALIAALGVIDDGLLVVLRAARLLPEEFLGSLCHHAPT
jgi:purine-binding chemotaxis protein CheW